MTERGLHNADQPAVFFASLLSISACAPIMGGTQGTPFDVAKADQIRIGSTTKQQVESLLGKPQSQCLGVGPCAPAAYGGYAVPAMMQDASSAAKETWQYSYTEIDWEMIGAVARTGGGMSKAVQVVFSGNVVSDCIISESSSEATWNITFDFRQPNISPTVSRQRKCGSTPTQ